MKKEELRGEKVRKQSAIKEKMKEAIEKLGTKEIVMRKIRILE